MIRTVPTGDLGLDVLLGGGWRLVNRLGDRPSATVLLRGGTGAGKTLVGLGTGLALAEALGGDVIVGCVELLPNEYVAQVRSARWDIDEQRVIALPGRILPAEGPRVFCALLTELDPQAPDLVASLEALAHELTRSGVRPVVFIVDSLIEGYGIGTSSPRASADALMKFAAKGGYGLVLCEEAAGDQSSAWVFAADTVLELGVEPRERGRWAEVRKHRFGPSVSARHELDLGRGPPRVFPRPHAWMGTKLHEVLHAHGWTFLNGGRGTPPLMLDKALSSTTDLGRVDGGLTLVSSAHAGLGRAVAFGLLPAHSRSERDLVLQLDPLLLRDDGWTSAKVDVHYVPTAFGAAWALRAFVERFADVVAENGDGPRPRHRRIVVGDLGLVLSAGDALDWVEAVTVFGSLVVESGWGVPIVTYDGFADAPMMTEARAILASHADAWIHLTVDHEAHPRADVTERWRFRRRQFVSPVRLEALIGSERLSVRATRATPQP